MTRTNNSPQQISKELAARNLLMFEQPPLRLGARLKQTTFVEYLRLSSVATLFPSGDAASMRLKILADALMDREVTLQELRAFTQTHYSEHPRRIAYWQRVAKILWLQFAAYLEMRALADKAVELALEREMKKARRKLAEQKRLIERHRRDSALRKKRWGQRA